MEHFAIIIIPGIAPYFSPYVVFALLCLLFLLLSHVLLLISLAMLFLPFPMLFT